jgi:RsiW-degrading membrane proteinase PrsW (M82 family)/rRNA maturation protein Nop10
LILGAVPGLLWLFYFYLRPPTPPRSLSNILRVFLCGCVCTVPAGFLEHITEARIDQDTIQQAAITSFLLVAPIEEFFKLLAVWVAVYRSNDFREPIDGVIYSVTAALGFASVENIVYLGLLGPEVFLLRALFATPAHVMFSVMWGYSMGLARFRRDRELLIILKGFIAAVVLHGGYNFLVAAHPPAAWIALIPLMVFMAFLMIRIIRKFRKDYPFPPIGEGAVICCPTCGAYTVEGDELCSRCGARIPFLEMDAPRFCGRCRAILDPCQETCSRCGEPVSILGLCPPAM